MKKQILKKLIIIGLILSFFSLSASAVIVENSTDNDKSQYALLIGYGAGSITVTKDAVDMKNLLLKFGWKEENIKSVLAMSATKENIIEAITGWLDTKEQSNDDVLIYFSIHGGRFYEADVNDEQHLDEPDKKDEFICPVDFVLRYPSWPFTPFGCEYSLAIIDEELEETISILESENIAVIFESCFSGGMIDGEQDLAKPGRVILTSSESDKPSWFSKYSMRAYFTKNLIDGLEGEADKKENGGNGDKKVSLQEAFNYAKPRTTEDVQNRYDESQIPQIYNGYGSEFNIIDLSKEKKSKEIQSKTSFIISKIVKRLLERVFF